MKNLFCILAIAFVLMGLSPMQTNSDIYVSTTGNDANSGTSVSPLRTIQKAVSIVVPGTTINVMPGTYNENVILSKSGTVSSPITLTGTGVILNGGTGIAIRNQGVVSYWTIQGLTIKSTGRYTIRLGWWGEPVTDHITVIGNMVTGANYIMGNYHLWEGNDISGVGYTGTQGDAGISDAGDSHHNIYRNNTIHDFTSYNARGIWSQGFTHETIIENNNIKNIMPVGSLGQCIDLDGYQAVEWKHIVRGNIVENCSYVGIQLENVFDSIVENNNIKNSGKSGITVISYDNNGCKQSGIYGDQNGDGNCQGDNTMNIIRGNTITADSWGAGYGGIINWYAGGVSILNNTVTSKSQNGNGAINIDGTLAQTNGTIIKGNILSQAGGVAICAEDFKSISEDSGNDLNLLYGTGDFCYTRYTLAQYKTLTGKGLTNTENNPRPTATLTKIPTRTVTPIPTNTAIPTLTATPKVYNVSCSCIENTCTCVVK